MSPDSAPERDQFSPDRPIASESEDALGFKCIADRLATSILSQASAGGLVVGLEGKWGSGKSSLLNLLATKIATSAVNNGGTPQVLHFAPWIVSNRAAMLTTLMGDIANAIEAAAPKQAGSQSERIKRAATKLREYTGNIANRVAPVASLVGLMGVPFAEQLSKILGSTSAVMDELNGKKSITALKAELIKDLEGLLFRIVVIIDDLDRLEPAEIVEVMRLVRAVADFPNVVYVLSYDPQILAISLNAELKIDDGSSYLHKIVQVSFKVPRPQPFDLRNWLYRECIALRQNSCLKPPSSDELERLHLVCQIEGGRIETPRDVVRALNLVKLYWPPIAEQVDYADLVWLQLLKATDQRFYEFVERYLSEFSAVVAGAMITESERAQFSSEFESFLTDDTIAPRAMYTLNMFLPGLKGIKEARMFNVRETEIASLVRDRRLGSPQHFRYFFAFSLPAGALLDSDFGALLAAASEGKNLKDHFGTLIYEHRPQGGLMLGVIIDRLTNVDIAKLSPKAIHALVTLLGDSLDEAGRLTGRGDFGRIPSWSDGHRLLRILLRNLETSDRKSILRSLFLHGKSMGWLMSNVLRHEIFSHGRCGEGKEPKDEWLLSESELDTAIRIWVKRAKTTERANVANWPHLLSVLYGWQQSGNETSLRKWLREQTSDDSKFLRLLNNCRGWMQSDKTYYPLRKEDLEFLVGYDIAMKRLTNISESRRHLPSDQALAQELLEAVKIGER